ENSALIFTPTNSMKNSTQKKNSMKILIISLKNNSELPFLDYIYIYIYIYITTINSSPFS
ncbi:MAG: hypothetical protein N7Q72_07675, partial [Spiroplasma sp. Tabriz.8]|nr:hypothetical protein [Spiroplasma sp. Tabriz.8]